MIPRRNHVAESINDYMMIFGGIDDHDVFLNDFWILDLFIMKWIKMETKGLKPNPIAFMCSSLIIPSDKRSNSHFDILKPEVSTRSYSKV